MTSVVDLTQNSNKSSAPSWDAEAHKIYIDYLTKPEEYIRIHVHVLRIENKTSHASGLPWNPDPYVKMEVTGDDTGSTDYFNMTTYQTKTIRNQTNPEWDSKGMMICKKGPNTKLKIQMWDEDLGSEKNDDLCFETEVDFKDFPSPGEGWKSFNETSSVESAEKPMKNCTLFFKVKTSEGNDRVVTKEDYDEFCKTQPDESVIYEEIPIQKEQTNRALLQAWRQKDAKKAILWVLGRNDSFSHVHVAKRLFVNENNKIDLFVMNYVNDGKCREWGGKEDSKDCEGFCKDPLLNSHSGPGTFDETISGFDDAIAIMNSHGYEKKYAYAHSTGGPVLLNYLMAKGDSQFESFMFNDIFLDWGYVGSFRNFGVAQRLMTQVLKIIGTFRNLVLFMNFESPPAATPDAYKDTPLMYRGKAIVPSAWSLKFWSQYYYDFEARPMYEVPLTLGFVTAVGQTHSRIIRSWNCIAKNEITEKPFYLISSRQDDVLQEDETSERSKYIGPNVTYTELKYNAHDVFISDDRDDTFLAIEKMEEWMKKMKIID